MTLMTLCHSTVIMSARSRLQDLVPLRRPTREALISPANLGLLTTTAGGPRGVTDVIVLQGQGAHATVYLLYAVAGRSAMS